jgi:hypothetical protein
LALVFEYRGFAGELSSHEFCSSLPYFSRRLQDERRAVLILIFVFTSAPAGASLWRCDNVTLVVFSCAALPEAERLYIA